MSKLSFKSFCIEKYADYKSMPSNEVYRLFEENGVIEMLNRDYDILHGFGFEYIVRDIDYYLVNPTSWPATPTTSANYMGRAHCMF